MVRRHRQTGLPLHRAMHLAVCKRWGAGVWAPGTCSGCTLTCPPPARAPQSAAASGAPRRCLGVGRPPAAGSAGQQQRLGGRVPCARRRRAGPSLGRHGTACERRMSLPDGAQGTRGVQMHACMRRFAPQQAPEGAPRLDRACRHLQKQKYIHPRCVGAASAPVAGPPAFLALLRGVRGTTATSNCI